MVTYTLPVWPFEEVALGPTYKRERERKNRVKRGIDNNDFPTILMRNKMIMVIKFN